ncbi:MAG: NifB/NifX family molybdenum-iron cluster-binding protein [Desulfosalsimonas sp.]|uniref:NifB/NifX family molybdenum-iron cluster-binding protein n=1 Tax=Desulfosalsimonas sp. TaxID=3073848 RepID=UPI003970A4AA
MAPHFGSSSELLFYELAPGFVREKEIQQLTVNDPMQMARKIAESKPDALVCGGIQNFCKKWLELRGIVVLDNYKGDVQQVVGGLKDSVLI